MERNDETLYLPSFGTERSHVETTSDKLTSLKSYTYTYSKKYFIVCELYSLSLQVKLVQIEAYQQEVESALVGVATPDPTHIEELIKRGDSFDIYVPEIKALKVVSVS